MVPSAFSHAVLGVMPCPSRDHQFRMRQDRGWSTRLRVTDRNFVCLKFENNHTNSCRCVTKMLTGDPLAHCSFCTGQPRALWPW